MSVCSAGSAAGTCWRPGPAPGGRCWCPARCDAGLEERDVAVAALAAEAAVARDDQLLGRDVLERACGSRRRRPRAIDLQRPVADDADADLLRQPALHRPNSSMSLKLRSVISTVQTSPLQRVQVQIERRRVARVVDHPLHVGVAPARVDPDLDVVEPLHLAVVALDHELHLVAASRRRCWPRSAASAPRSGCTCSRRRAARAAPCSSPRPCPRSPRDGPCTCGVWMSRNRPITCEQQVPKRTGLRVLRLRQPPDLRRSRAGGARSCRRRAASASRCRSR